MFPGFPQYGLLEVLSRCHYSLPSSAYDLFKSKTDTASIFQGQMLHTSEDEEPGTTVLSTSNIRCNTKVIFFGLSEKDINAVAFRLPYHDE